MLACSQISPVTSLSSQKARSPESRQLIAEERLVFAQEDPDGLHHAGPLQLGDTARGFPPPARASLGLSSILIQGPNTSLVDILSYSFLNLRLFFLSLFDVGI